MALYEENDETLTVDCGGGRSITLLLTGDSLNVSALRLLWHKQKQASRDEKRIAQFEKELEREGLTDDEYNSLTERIRALEEKPDNLSMLIDQVYCYIKSPGWTDYYPSKQAEERGELAPFSKESIGKMGAKALVVITRALTKHYGLDALAEDAEPGEAEGTSPAPLQLVDAIPSNIPTGIPSSELTEQ